MNLGGAEILVVIVVAVMVLGPDKLPAALRMFGKTMGEVRKYQDMAKSEINKAMEYAENHSTETTSQTSEENLDEKIEPEPLESEKDIVKKSPKASKSKSDSDSVAPILDEDE